MRQMKHVQWGAILFLVLACSFLAYQRLHKPRILIVHSYHPQMPWVVSLNQGVAKVFGDKAYIDLRYFYMDTKHKNSPRFLHHIQSAIYNSINRWKPDLVIAFDYDAQNVIDDLLRKGMDCKVIFAGITNEQRLNAFNKNPNITGITEKIPVLAVREILSLIFRDRRKIYYLSDNSTAARSLDIDISKQNWGSYQLVAHKRVNTLKEWRNAVREAQKEADILLVSVYHTLRDGKRRVNRKQLVSWMNQYSKIPVVGLYESFMVDGGMLAIAISSMEQGLTAAQMALKVVEKKIEIKEIPVQQGRTFSLFIDKPELLKHFPDAQIPMILDAFARSHWSTDTDAS